MRAEQLLLNLRPRVDARLSDFAVPAYADVMRATQGVVSEPGSRLYLHGEPEHGHEHWLSALCAEAEQAGLRVLLLPLQALRDEDPALLGGLEAQDLLVFEDVAAVAGHKAWEEALFHLFNRATAAGCRLVFSAPHRANQCGIVLADLVSRLSLAPAWALATPDDDSRAALIRIAAQRRGWLIEPDALRYLALRAPRSVQPLLELLEKIDKQSLVVGRRITVPFLSELLRPNTNI